jgi:hypothetical protein
MIATDKLTPEQDVEITSVAKVIAGTLIAQGWNDFMKEMFLAQLRAELEIGE